MANLKFKNSSLFIFKYIKLFFFWLGLTLLLGICCGVLGGLFSKSISLVTEIRLNNEKLIFLLPIFALLSVLIFKLCRVESFGTGKVFNAAKTEETVPVLLAPAIFIGSVITHLFGGSAGKEGAALQLGGSISSAFSRIFKLDNKNRQILTVCGMAGLFSAAFGTGVSAAVFSVEVLRAKNKAVAFIPALTTALIAKATTRLMGISSEHFEVLDIPEFELKVLLKIAIIGAVCGVVGFLFCYALHFSKKLFEKYLKNAYLRIFVGSLIIVALTIIIGTTDYNGSGIGIIEGIFENNAVRPEAFLIKIIFTAITVGAGLKGGEIVPTMFIGASLGATVGGFLNLGTSYSAAAGLATLFGAVTNCPITAFAIALELFGDFSLLPLIIPILIGYFLSGKVSLYTHKKS